LGKKSFQNNDDVREFFAKEFEMSMDEAVRTQQKYTEDMTREEVAMQFGHLQMCMDTHYYEYAYPALSGNSKFSKAAYFGSTSVGRNTTRRGQLSASEQLRKSATHRYAVANRNKHAFGIELIEAAAGENSGTTKENAEESRHQTMRMEVPSVAIRDVIKHIIPEEMKIDLLKIDSQGLDLAIFESSMEKTAGTTIGEENPSNSERSRKFNNVVLEVQHLPTDHPLFMYDAGPATYNFTKLVETMDKHGYDLCDCVLNNCAAVELDCSFLLRT